MHHRFLTPYPPPSPVCLLNLMIPLCSAWLSLPCSVIWSITYLPAKHWGGCRVHLIVSLLFMIIFICCLLSIQCLKTVVSYILCSLLVVQSGRASLVPPNLLWSIARSPSLITPLIFISLIMNMFVYFFIWLRAIFLFC